MKDSSANNLFNSKEDSYSCLKSGSDFRDFRRKRGKLYTGHPHVGARALHRPKYLLNFEEEGKEVKNNYH